MSTVLLCLYYYNTAHSKYPVKVFAHLNDIMLPAVSAHLALVKDQKRLVGTARERRGKTYFGKAIYLEFRRRLSCSELEPERLGGWNFCYQVDPTRGKLL